MRASGILLHITSLPSPYGIGDLGPSAYAWTDFLKSAGQRYWQMLPVNPTDGINGYSPYSCASAFAGNPLFISPAALIEDGFLKSGDVKGIPAFDKAIADYDRAAEFKQKLLDVAFDRWVGRKDQRAYEHFCAEHDDWLEDYALFAVAKRVYKGKSWGDWPAGLRRRNAKALAAFAKENSVQVKKIKFTQFIFFTQWNALKKYAHSQGIRIIGDIPIYVNYDSVEVWCYPQYFKLDESKRLKFVSGCPPDYFSKTGQRWGNPVYDWEHLKKDKYSWWIRRVEHNLKLFDYLRIDHFRGFVSYWQIPAHERFAVFGRWVKGRGKDFFNTLLKRFSHLPIIAEDLGEITPDVTAVMEHFKFPGMRVMLFGLGGDTALNPHAPANYPSNCVAYTGTHDNNTIVGWYQHEAKPQEKANIPKVLKQKVIPKQIHWQFIEAIMHSKASTVIVPLPDVLGFGQEARMNTPATKINNWRWRFNERMLTRVLAGRLRKLTQQTKRV